MAKRHHIDPCERMEATTRLTGFPFNRGVDIRSLV